MMDELLKFGDIGIQSFLQISVVAVGYLFWRSQKDQSVFMRTLFDELKTELAASRLETNALARSISKLATLIISESTNDPARAASMVNDVFSGIEGVDRDP